MMQDMIPDEALHQTSTTAVWSRSTFTQLCCLPNDVRTHHKTPRTQDRGGRKTQGNRQVDRRLCISLDSPKALAALFPACSASPPVSLSFRIVP